MPETLRATLLKLRILEPVTKYSRAMVSVTFGKLSKSIPNPRFINKKEANFYRFRLELANESSQRIFIKIYGLNNADNEMEEILSEEIPIAKIQNNQPRTSQNAKVRIDFEMALSHDQNPLNEEHESSRTEINLETEELSDNHSFFQPCNMKKSSTFSRKETPKPNGSETKSNKNNKQFDQLSDSVEKSALLSEKEYQDAHQTRTIYRKNSGNSEDVFTMQNKSDYNFMQPVTHTPPRSPRTVNKKNVFNVFNQFGLPTPGAKPVPKQKPKAPKSVSSGSQLQTSDLVGFVGVSVVSFVVGVLVKKGLI